MPSLRHAALLAVSLVLLGGCCRDTMREMASLKDGTLRPQQQRSAKATSEKAVKAARVNRDDDDDDDDDDGIKTGSIVKPVCQGPHIAYQATREYLKNFGPKPPDMPGDQGPCTPAH